MPSGACTIKRAGVRATTWSIKYRDATGRQIKERLGSTAEGWTKRKAEGELRARLVAVAKDGFRKIEAVTFETFAAEWLDTVPTARNLKRSTVGSYRTIIESHLIPHFRSIKLDKIDVERVERYVAEKRGSGLDGASVNRHLNLLNSIMTAAVKRSLARVNPVPMIDRPRESRRRWRILSPAETVAVEKAFGQLIEEAEDDAERAWRQQARVVFVVLVGAGLRRGELLGLRWRNVHLADPDGAYLRVAETWVRDAIDTPKSEAGERTVALGQKVATELFEHRSMSAFDGEDERVFCHPLTGGPMSHKRYAETFRLALVKAGITDFVRPFHDMRHSSITNSAAAGTSPHALMARAGHSDFKTTQRYIDLAGETFRTEADRLERRLWGATGTKTGYQNAEPATEEATEAAA